MDIIVLEGPSNSGKTETIGLVYAEVLKHGGASTNKKKLNSDPKDFSDIVINYKNKKIGFFSMGDNSTILAKAVYDFDRLNCDLVICALSNGTPKVRANNAIKKYKSTKISKSYSNNSTLWAGLNQSDAINVFSLI